MNKNTLVIALKDKLGYSLADCEAFLNAFVGVVKDTLKSGENITLANFGVFKTRIRPPHEDVNPDTGEQVWVENERVASFKVSKGLIDYLND